MRLEESEWAKWISGAEETGNANGSREECSWQERGNSMSLISMDGAQGG